MSAAISSAPSQQNSMTSSAAEKTRSRSSSKTKSNYNPLVSHEQQQASLRSESGMPAPPQFDQLVWVLKLRSLNNTFDSKILIVPEPPETLKFGRPGGTKIQSKPTNGYFDSRVLSRNHAELFIDAQKGALFIRDLKSSNGTYINGKQIEPFKNYELKTGDQFDLGSNLENQTTHKKISCEISDLLLMEISNYADIIYKADHSGQNGDKQFFSTVMDVLMYGDVVQDMYEDNLLRLLADEETLEQTKRTDNLSMSGLYPSSNIKNSSKLEETISQLVILISNETLQNEKLSKIYRFLNNYNENLDKYEEFIKQRSLEQASGESLDQFEEQQTHLHQAEMKLKEAKEQISHSTQQLTVEREAKSKLQAKNDALSKQLVQQNAILEEKDVRIENYQIEMDRLRRLLEDKSKIIEMQAATINEQAEKEAEMMTNEEVESADEVSMKSSESIDDESDAQSEDLPDVEKEELKNISIEGAAEDEQQANGNAQHEHGDEVVENQEHQMEELPMTGRMVAEKQKEAIRKTSVMHAGLVLVVSIILGAAFYQNK